MVLRKRWIVRLIDRYDFNYPEGATHCVECRATCAIAFYGTLSECRRVRKERNAQ